MTKFSSSRWRLCMAALVLAVSGAAALVPYSHARAADTAVAPADDNVAQYADQIGRLVQDHKIDELAKLDIPAGAQTGKLEEWKTQYVDAMRQAEELREKHYDEAVAKARELLDQNKLDLAIERAGAAYVIASDRDAFLALDWVKDLTTKVAVQAAEYEKNGKWLESLQLYTDLNSLYEIDTRYKADMQRLARRTRLLALYTPQTLYDMRQSMLKKIRAEDNEKAPTEKVLTTRPAGEATSPPDADENEPPTFTRWQDAVAGADLEMSLRSLDQARENWVEPTNYETLLHGGVDALRLFLTTPELAKEFPGLGQEKSNAAFGATLDNALAQIKSGERMDMDTFHKIYADILASNQTTIGLPTEVITMEFTDGAMEKLDPFTAVIWPHELDEFKKATKGVFGGVGIQILLDANGRLNVVSPLEETPAYYAGIEAGDIITAIDGKTTTGISIDQAVHQIMGKPDTTVVLTIKRPGKTELLTFNITRALIRVTSVKGYKRDPADPTRWLYMIDPDSKIGYVRITGFQDDTYEELKAAMDSLHDQGARGVVLDLRFNPGGLLKAAIDMSRMFLNTDHDPIPTIVSTKGNMTARWEAKARGTPFVSPSLPTVVLVNQYSASASEIFSGALKDLHRALIVGNRSFGKGSVQDVMPLDDDDTAEIKLTKQYYYLPDGESLHRRDGEKKWGVEPDISVPMTPNQITALLESRRDEDIILRSHAAATGAATQAAQVKVDPVPDPLRTPAEKLVSTPASAVPATEPASTQKATAATQPEKEHLLDTQLDTALLMLRLQLVQSPA